MKIMMLEVQEYEGTWRRIVEVEGDEKEYTSSLRATILKNIIKEIEDEPGFSQYNIFKNNDELMKKLAALHIRLVDTGLNKMPITEEEYEQAYKNAGVK